MFVFSQFDKLLPDIFENYYITFSSIHNIATRGNKTNFIIPTHNSNMGAKTVKVYGAFLWNELSLHIKRCSTI